MLSYKSKSIVFQVRETLQEMCHYGESKRAAKQDGSASGKIFSYSTYRDYLKHSIRFGQWCKAEHGCKTVQDCRQYASAWLKSEVNRGLSAYTVRLEASALAKLYQCKSTDFDVKLPQRQREAITRSRNPAARDQRVSQERNRDMITFAKCTGLRRSEYLRNCGNQIECRNGRWFLVSIVGKGGRVRDVPIIGDVETVRKVMQRAGSGPICGKLHTAMDIHGYRREYANTLYRSLARPLEECKRVPFAGCRDSVYRCRDGSGRWYDKAAMAVVSAALGHTRISVIGEHYLD